VVIEGSSQRLPSCSVVVCTRDRPVALDRCLEAVSRLAYPQVRVLVVDSAPKDNRALEVARRWGASYVAVPVPGLSRARNRGARECDTEIVAYLDDDAVPEPKWLSALAEEFKDPRVMAVTGRTLPLGEETEAEAASRPVCDLDLSPERRVVDQQTPLWFELANFGGIGGGTNMAFRRHAFELWPGFDERLGLGALVDGFEEHHAFFALIDRGYRVVYTPHAVVRHPYPRTMPELRVRHIRSLSAAAAYMTFLLVEESRYRWAVILYVAQAVRGKRRAWRPLLPGTQPYARIVPRWRAFLAYLSGPFLYARSRFQQRAKTS
jgi:cellulose synthase/poly-beta-1,6-N-acetylglucosamine synthase-like glycosyltransferase